MMKIDWLPGIKCMVEAIQKKRKRLPEDPPVPICKRNRWSQKDIKLRKTDSRSVTTNVRNTRLVQIMSPSEIHRHFLSSIVDS
jgi:hypothetical protein